MVKYKRTDDSKEFGSYIPYYEYSVPEGWKVGNTTSTGPSNYILGGPAETITYDQIHNGEIKIRATQRNYLCSALPISTASDWATIPFTRPDVSITANGNNLTCGSTTPATFTVVNGPSASCFTYVWNLGSNNNNWLYNGSAAQQFITTTSNSITLTPATCTGKPGDVSVSVQLNGTTVKTLSIPVTMSIPAFGISGPDVICTSGNYTIDNLPCNATVNWSYFGNDLATVSTNGNAATVTATGTGGGLTNMTATITGVCAAAPITTPTKQIRVGLPSYVGYYTSNGLTYGLVESPDLDPTNPVCYTANPTNVDVTMNLETSSTIQWEKTYSSPSTLGWGRNGNGISFYFKGIGQRIIFKATISNSCGPIVKLFGFQSNSCMSLASEKASARTASENEITLSPNPATSQVTIKLTSGNTVITSNTGDKINAIRIFDVMGRLRKQQHYNNATNVTINVSDLLTGLYFVEITKGKETIRKNLNIKR